ncbi:metallophosphoesterase [Pedobacter agri]|uniref:metallophosphoesterase n=1 Tax=Pedobacter agri TaxID=454586 RepID=UPI00292D1B87|nr:metallophosphoesterase [Pedobacter agri]
MKKRIIYIISGLIAIWIIGLAISLVTGAIKITFNEGGDKPDVSGKTDDGPYLHFKGDNGFLGYYINGKYVLERKPKQDFLNKSFKVITDIPEDSFSVVIKDEVRIQPDVYGPATKILAISDIEGNFYALKRILQSNGVIDNLGKWTYGTNHLVIIGDLVDRGLEVTQCLWLIYGLENKAEKAGGKVHYILGNHETMVMAGDVRYTRKKYKELAEAMQFDYSKDVLGKNSEIGKWLRSKNIIEKIGNVLFVHAGISENILDAQLNIKKINDIGRQYYGASKDSISESNLAREIYGKKGPLWYRGILDEKLSSEEVSSILNLYAVENIVFGHSIVENIKGFYDNSLIGIDLIQPPKDSPLPVRALLIDSNRFYEVNSKGERKPVNN